MPGDLVACPVESDADAAPVGVEATAYFIHREVHRVGAPGGGGAAHPHALCHGAVPPAARRVEEWRARMPPGSTAGSRGAATMAAWRWRRTRAGRSPTRWARRTWCSWPTIGVIVVGRSVAEAFDDLYYVERAAEAQILAETGGHDLADLAEEVLRSTAAEIASTQPEAANAHLAAIKRPPDGRLTEPQGRGGASAGRLPGRRRRPPFVGSPAAHPRPPAAASLPRPWATPPASRRRRPWRSASPRRRLRRRSRHARTFTGIISAQGVTTRVSTVAKLSPKTIAVDSPIHHWVDGAPTETSRVRKSMLTPQHHRHQAEDGGDRGQHDRPQTLGPGAQDRLVGGAADRLQVVVGVDQHDVVVSPRCPPGRSRRRRSSRCRTAGPSPSDRSARRRWT